MHETEPAICIHDLRKTYRNKDSNIEKEALKGVSLDIPRGSFFGLLGPNGAGKSTLINIMAGLIHKSSGVVKICGHDIERNARKARLSIGIVPQELMLDTFFTVRQALEITAGYYGVPKKHRRTQEIIEAMGLEDKADVTSRGLSGGMRRRLLIGKALVHQPDVLVLDEPTAGVDVELRQSLWKYVRELNERGTTILLTTHYLEEAEELCDEIAIINHGDIITRDSKDNLMRSMDSKVLVLRFHEPLTELPKNLRAIEGASLNNGCLEIQYQPSKTPFEEIFAQVQNTGLGICDLTTKEAELEDIFRELTRDKVA